MFVIRWICTNVNYLVTLYIGTDNLTVKCIYLNFVNCIRYFILFDIFEHIILKCIIYPIWKFNVAPIIYNIIYCSLSPLKFRCLLVLVVTNYKAPYFYFFLDVLQTTKKQWSGWLMCTFQSHLLPFTIKVQWLIPFEKPARNTAFTEGNKSRPHNNNNSNNNDGSLGRRHLNGVKCIISTNKLLITVLFVQRHHTSVRLNKRSNEMRRTCFRMV